MPFKTLSASLSVAPQLTAGDVAEAARAGFRAIIDNRPDGEEPGQPTAAEIRDLAASHGMSFAHVPTLGGAVADEHVMQMAQTLARLDGPSLAYSRTGMRSATLWALTQAEAQQTDVLIMTAAAAGYDLSTLRSRLDARRDAKTPMGPKHPCGRLGFEAAVAHQDDVP